MAVLTRLVLVAVLLTSGSVEGTRLSMSPNTIVDGKTSTLTIRCYTDAASSDNVYVMKITKPPSTTNLAIVDSNGARVDSSIQQRATATGTVSPAAGSNLALTFTDAITCSYAGDYQCQYCSLNTQTPTINQMLQATSDPSNIEMVARPILDFYNERDTVELVCSGFLGKPAAGTWIWETRDVSFGSTWTSLRPGLTPVDGTPAESGLCQMTGNSTLTFQLQMEDDKRMYRCYYRDLVYSGNLTFNVMAATSPTSAPQNTTSTRTAATSPTSAPQNTTSTRTVAGCARSEIKGLTVGAGLAIWAFLTFLLTLEGQGYEQLSFD